MTRAWQQPLRPPEGVQWTGSSFNTACAMQRHLQLETVSSVSLPWWDY